MTSRLHSVAALGVVALLYAAFRLAGQSDWLLVSARWADAVDGVLKIGLWVVPCALAVVLIERLDPRRLLDRLGLAGSVPLGYAFGLVSILPMLAVLRAQGTLHIAAASILGSVVLGPFAEEVLFRGYLFNAFRMRAGWPVRTAILTSGLVFGLAHFGNVDLSAPGSRVMAIGEVGTTAAGGVLFAWIVYRWNSLWPAVGLHTFMNLTWEIFGVGDWTRQLHAGADAAGTTVANAARLVSVIVAVYLTIRWNRRGRPIEGAPTVAV